MEARSVLSMILSKPDEADWAGAEKLLAELMTRYPRNPLYRLRRTFVAEKRGDWASAVALADPDGAWIEGLHPGLRAHARDWALYRAGEAELLSGKAASAAKRFARIDEKTAPKSLRRWLLRRKGELRSPAAAPSKTVAPFFTGY
jgi:hypothetical protein